MAVQLEYVALSGGLDESSGKTLPRPGRLIGCENFEIVYGTAGYQRARGYERFDGQTAPSTATYFKLAFTAGSNAPAGGATITTATGSAKILTTGGVLLASGSWAGGTAAGELLVTMVTGTFSPSQTITVGATTIATSGTFGAASAGDSYFKTATRTAREMYRALITKPTGEGAILGLAVFQGIVYALRNVAGGTSATLWKSTASGWSAVRTGLRPSGKMRSVVANFTGTSTSVALYCCDGKNRPWRISTDGTFTFLPAIYNTEAASSTAITPALGSQTFVLSEYKTTTWFPTPLIIYSLSNPAIYMIATPTSFSIPATSLTVNVTAIGTATSANDWHICRNDGIDRPFEIAEHKNHLFLAYPQGQLQHSNLGDPMTYTTSAGSIGLGDEIQQLQTLRADVLGIFQTNRVSLLYGASKATWDLKFHSQSANTRADSVQEIGGNAVYVNDAGIMSLAGTQAFGDFDALNLGVDVNRTLDSLLTGYQSSTLSKAASQYRIYGVAKQALVMSFAAGTIAPQTISFTKLKYQHQPVCSAVGTIANEEAMFFGTDDGWVMRERTGTTYDGTAITAFFRTSYWHSKNPQLKKRYRKLMMDLDATTEPVPIFFKQDFDFSGPDYTETQNYTVNPSGGLYDVDYWNEFFWSSPEAAQVEANIDGVGRHMSILLWCEEDAEPFTVYGMALQFSPLEIKR